MSRNAKKYNVKKSKSARVELNIERIEQHQKKRAIAKQKAKEQRLSKCPQNILQAEKHKKHSHQVQTPYRFVPNRKG